MAQQRDRAQEAEGRTTLRMPEDFVVVSAGWLRASKMRFAKAGPTPKHLTADFYFFSSGGVFSPSFIPALKFLMPSPKPFPISDSRPGPKISSAITRITISSGKPNFPTIASPATCVRRFRRVIVVANTTVLYIGADDAGFKPFRSGTQEAQSGVGFRKSAPTRAARAPPRPRRPGHPRSARPGQR